MGEYLSQGAVLLIKRRLTMQRASRYNNFNNSSEHLRFRIIEKCYDREEYISSQKPREKMGGVNLQDGLMEVALEQWTERSKERRQRFRNLVRRMKTVWNGCRMSGL